MFNFAENPGFFVDNRNRYFCAVKEKFSILLKAISDADRRFMWFNIICTPTTHYYLLCITTELGKRFERGELPHPFYLLFDNTFT